ncbi:MAG: hypothetical protein FJ405_18280 [Verrucomicrobia bacterium]|nr:hypothetical protein [Verrucomicrobiota bacterium]
MNLHRQFFDEIAAGTKTKEYREDTDYWRRRLEGRSYTEIHFRNGYATKAPFMRVEFKAVRKVGPKRDAQFVISLGRVLELKNYRKRKDK